jgi:hypothetical protein
MNRGDLVHVFVIASMLEADVKRIGKVDVGQVSELSNLLKLCVVASCLKVIASTLQILTQVLAGSSFGRFRRASFWFCDSAYLWKQL